MSCQPIQHEIEIATSWKKTGDCRTFCFVLCELFFKGFVPAVSSSTVTHPNRKQFRRHAPTVNVDLSEIPDALTFLEGIYQRMTCVLSGFPGEHSRQHVTDVILCSEEQSNYDNAGSFFIQQEPDGGLFHAHEVQAA